MEPLPNEAVNPQTQAAELTEELVSRPETDSGPEGAWRDELSARLSRYRSRRKAPPPRYPSLTLPFEASELLSRPAQASQPPFESVSHQALALDGLPQAVIASPDTSSQNPRPASEPQPRPEGRERHRAKIIEFPGFNWGPPIPPADQLAEPVMDRPRILEVPEVAPPPPALGGIMIEPVKTEDSEKRPGIDIPLQSARLGLRLCASVIDGLVIALASALFGYIFWKITAIRPPGLQFVFLVVGIPSAFWAAYQYLLIIYGGTTPGLRLVGLEMTRFDGTSTTRSLRRWRILASYLSAASLGMGYAWVFLDEDALCWHDRITHTYLAPRKR